MSPPKIPHIVGDDEDAQEEASKNDQESDGNSNDSHLSPPKITHIVGDDEDAQEEASKNDQESDGNSNDSHLSSEQEEDENSNEDEMDLDGSDWSKNVIYLTGTPKRAELPVITNTPALPLDSNSSIPTSDPLQSPSLGTSRRPFTSRKNHASGSIGKRVSRRLRGNSHIKQSPNAADPDLEPPAQLAKPVDVTGYFHRVSANLVEQRVTLKSFEALRKRITPMVTKTLKESKSMRK